MMYYIYEAKISYRRHHYGLRENFMSNHSGKFKTFREAKAFLIKHCWHTSAMVVGKRVTRIWQYPDTLNPWTHVTGGNSHYFYKLDKDQPRTLHL